MCAESEHDPFRYSERVRFVILNDDGVWSGDAMVVTCTCPVSTGGSLSPSESCLIHAKGGLAPRRAQSDR